MYRQQPFVPSQPFTEKGLRQALQSTSTRTSPVGAAPSDCQILDSGRRHFVLMGVAYRSYFDKDRVALERSGDRYAMKMLSLLLLHADYYSFLTVELGDGYGSRPSWESKSLAEKSRRTSDVDHLSQFSSLASHVCPDCLHSAINTHATNVFSSSTLPALPALKPSHRRPRSSPIFGPLAKNSLARNFQYCSSI
jgi:hypothetical protein